MKIPHAIRSCPTATAQWKATTICTLGIALMSVTAGCKNGGGSVDPDDQPARSAAKSPAQISVVNGETVITLDADTQTRLGLTLAAISTTTSRAQQTYPAIVLSTADLVSARGSYLAAQSQLKKAHVQADVANKEYARLKSLYAEDQNISQKSLEAAEGDAQSSQSDVTAAEQQVTLQKSLIGQQWGATIEEWAQNDSPTFESILNLQDALVQVTVPGDSSVATPKSVSMESLDGSRTEATLVSAFPRVDSRVQGRNYLYLMSPRAPVAPETTLLAHVSIGGTMKGVVVPTSAVVWSEGKAWAYQQSGDSQFTRRAVATDVPISGGFFVSSGVVANAKIVTVGAQALLSEEFLLRGASAGENND
jgi:multidrug efflux system membrane fusion protein